MTTVRSPMGPLPEFVGTSVNPMPSLAGKTIAVLDNSKHNAGELLERIRLEIDAMFPDIVWLYERKAGAFRPVADDIEERIVKYADLVLTGNGDCGCVSWSASDAVRFEKAGIPVILFATTPFVPLARQLTRGEGLADVRIVDVPHPVGGLQAAQIDERAADIRDAVIKIVAA